MPVVEVNSTKLNYREAGCRDKPTIVFLYPVLFDSTVFDHLVAELANDFHLIVLDLHGHRESGYRLPLTLESMTEDYDALLTKLGFSKIAWVGYSIGGMIGMRLALSRPQLVDSLILIATSARPDPPEIRQQSWALWEMFRDGHRQEVVDPALRFFFAPNSFETQPQLIAEYRHKITNYSEKQANAMFEVAGAVFERSDISDAIHRIKAPTLIIAGTEDLISPQQESALIGSRISNARLITIANAGHLLVVEKPQEVTRSIRDFLKSERIGRGGAGHIKSRGAESRLAADLAQFFSPNVTGERS